ncbi:MAG TPA: WD40 repeat domain-containing protein [Gemmataceae bacterium]|jgi:WD40 repeat protein
MRTIKLKVGAMVIRMLGCWATATAGATQPTPPAKQPENKAEAPAQPRPAEKQVRKDRYGDALPTGAIARLGTVRLRHTGRISPVVFTPDGKTAIASDQHGNVVCWDVASGKEVRRLEKWGGYFGSLALSPDGKVLAAGDNGGRLILWDVATGKRLPPGELSVRHDGIGQILFTPDSRTLTLRGDKTILLWDAVHKKTRHELKGHPSYVKCMALSPDGKTLASAGESDPHIRLWDIASGKEKLRLAGDKSIEPSLAFSPDGKTLAVIGESSPLSFFDANTGKKLRTSKDPYVGLHAIQYAPDGKTLAGIERGTLCILDAASGKRLRKFDAAAPGISFSPDGKTIATFSAGAHTFDLWDVASGKLRHSFAGHTRGVTGLAFAADGKTLFSVEDDTYDGLLAWDAATGELRGHFREDNDRYSYTRLALSADGKLLAACGYSGLQLWDPTTRKKVRTCARGVGIIRSVAWSADSRTLVTGGPENAILHVWDATTGKERRAIKAKQDIPHYPGGVVLSPKGEIVAAGGYADGTIHLWSAATSKELRKIATPPIEQFTPRGHRMAYSMVEALTFNPDGSALASVGGKMIYLWDPATGRRLHHWAPKAARIGPLAFSGDGRTLVTGHNDPSVRLWEVATGKQRACFLGHRGAVGAVAFARDGRRVASGSEDTTILVWDATGGARPDAVLSAKQLQTLWADLIGTGASQAYRAMWQMTLAPKQSLPFLDEQLRRIARRDAEQQKKVARLIADLDDDQFAVREWAAGELEKMGSWIEPALRQALEGKLSLEVRRRIETVLEKVAGWSGERLRTLRALEAIEHMNAAEARRLLESLAKGTPQGWLTEEARKSRKRMDG